MPDSGAIFDSSDPLTEEEALAEGEADLRAGRIISHAAMTRWLQSWGKPEELPPSECGE